MAQLRAQYADLAAAETSKSNNLTIGKPFREPIVKVETLEEVKEEEKEDDNKAGVEPESKESKESKDSNEPEESRVTSEPINIPHTSYIHHPPLGATLLGASSEDLSPPSPGIRENEEDQHISQWSQNPEQTRQRFEQFGENVTDEELVAMLKETETLDENADILHYLVYHKGLKWNTGLGKDDQVVTVKDLLKDLYEKACQEKRWALVRHVAGMLGKRVEDLAKAVTDLLVRQKQITVGQPPHAEHTITRPIPSKELRAIINKAHGGDQSTAMLTQELLVYLAMFIRTEPLLFTEMLRLRVGLIIQVMASELGRALKCSGDEASDHLLNLSPYEMKTLLHHIISGKEFTVKSGMFVDSFDQIYQVNNLLIMHFSH